VAAGERRGLEVLFTDGQHLDYSPHPEKCKMSGFGGLTGLT
jgi:hypothetical protein